MLNKIQKIFIILWLLFAIFTFMDGLYHIFALNKVAKGFMFLGVSVFAYFMHRIRKKRYSNYG